VHAISWLCLALASIITPRSWQEKAAAPDRRSWRDRWRRFWFGDASWRRGFRARMLERNAFMWLASRERWKVAMVWAFLGVSAVFWLIGWWRTPRYYLETENYVFTSIALSLVIRIWIAVEAGQRFGTDRRNGVFELLLVTPLQVRDILHGQLLALRRQFLKPVAALLALHVLFLVLDYHHHAGVGKWVASITALVGDVLVLPWVAMWLSLRLGRPEQASGGAIIIVTLTPWMATAALQAAAMTYTYVLRWGHWMVAEEWLILVWTLASALNNLVLWTWSRHRLLHEFREVAARPIGKPAK
jgi:hypothetical protein